MKWLNRLAFSFQRANNKLNSNRLQKKIVIAAAFVSGFCIMAIEMLGARIMSPYFGGSLSVWGSVLTVFMLALSCGYLIGGRLSEGQPDIKTFAFFFMAAALASLPSVFFADGIMRPIFMAIEDPRYGSLTASVFLFFMPTTILGMISPYSIRLLVEHEDHSGKMAGQLFFVSTFGSALGTLGTAFYFVLWFDVNKILLGTIIALLFVGIIIFTFDIAARRSR